MGPARDPVGQVARRVYRKRFNLTSYATLQAEAMPIHSTGAAVSGGWALYSNGYVAQDVTVPQSGTYLFSVKARAPSRGRVPVDVVEGGWARPGQCVRQRPDWRTFSMSADLAAGTHDLAVSFDNDAYQAPADRNLFLDEIRYGWTPTPTPVC